MVENEEQIPLPITYQQRWTYIKIIIPFYLREIDVHIIIGLEQKVLQYFL